MEVTVRNPRSQSLSGTLEVTFDGETVSTHSATVEGGETDEIEIEVVVETPGSGVVAVDGVEAGQLTVGTEDDTPQVSPDGNDQNGLGVSSAVLAVLAAALYARVRSK